MTEFYNSLHDKIDERARSKLIKPDKLLFISGCIVYMKCIDNVTSQIFKIISNMPDLYVSAIH